MSRDFLPLRIRFLGQVRAVDATRSRCNFRRFPLPVSGRRSDQLVSARILLLFGAGMFSAGLALGIVVEAYAALKGVLP